MTGQLIAFCAAFALDLAFGDPLRRLHPIRLVGLLIARAEGALRRVFPKTDRGQYAAGAVLAVVVPALCFCAAFLLLRGLAAIHPWLAVAGNALLGWQLLAVKGLKTESMKVYHTLQTGSLAAARQAVSMIVGRDTASLDEAGVTRAAVETVAENTGDGAVAPLLFLAVGGAPLCFFYKAVNTLDSMVGYKNERYLYFGRASARLDDLLGLIPARLAALLMIAAAYLLGLDAKNAARVFARDRRKHASPNSAQTEAVCAGALGVRLAGDAFYFGRLCQKPAIGDPLRSIRPEDIPLANRLLYLTSGLCFGLCAGVQLLIILLSAW